MRLAIDKELAKRNGFPSEGEMEYNVICGQGGGIGPGDSNWEGREKGEFGKTKDEQLKLKTI